MDAGRNGEDSTVETMRGELALAVDQAYPIAVRRRVSVSSSVEGFPDQAEASPCTVVASHVDAVASRLGRSSVAEVQYAAAIQSSREP